MNHQGSNKEPSILDQYHKSSYLNLKNKMDQIFS